jgi:hypothetical protein
MCRRSVRVIWCNICMYSKAFQPPLWAKSHCVWVLGCLSLWVCLSVGQANQVANELWQSNRSGVSGTF